MRDGVVDDGDGTVDSRYVCAQDVAEPNSEEWEGSSAAAGGDIVFGGEVTTDSWVSRLMGL